MQNYTNLMESQTLRETLSQNLKKYRKVKDWSQFELAENAEISEQTINSIEGLRLWPSDKTLVKIAKALDVEIYSLFLPQNLKVKSEATAELKECVMKTVENLVHNILNEWQK